MFRDQNEAMLDLRGPGPEPRPLLTLLFTLSSKLLVFSLNSLFFMVNEKGTHLLC